MSNETSSKLTAVDFSSVINAGNKFDFKPKDMWKFTIAGFHRPAGYMPDEFFNAMNWDGTAFEVNKAAKTVHLNPDLPPGSDKIEACKEQFRKLCEANKSKFNGCLDKWLSTGGSYQAIRCLDESELVLQIPTPLRGIFGVATAGVHLNVYTKIGGKPYMWVAERSATATYARLMDQIVAGGMDPEDGHDEWRTLEHEAWEEANLVLDKKSHMVTTTSPEGNHIKVGEVQGPYFISFYDKKTHHASVEEEGHIEPGIRYVFDLEVPEAVKFTRSESKSVAGFDCKSVEDVKQDLIERRWKPNSALATLDFLLRHGLIENDENDTVKHLDMGLRRVLPLHTPMGLTS